MKKSELPLYLKISPIYNKILQLAIAVICIIIMMQVLIYSQNKQQKVITGHITENTQQQLEQAVLNLKVLLAQKNNDLVEDYIEQLSQISTIKEVLYYDHTGQLIAQSSEAESTKQLIMADESNKTDSAQYKIFVKEIYNPELSGYLRITLHEKLASTELNNANVDVHETMRLLALFAVIIGFFLTRGFSRFSRQGFRVAK